MKALHTIKKAYASRGKRIISLAFVLMLALCVILPIAIPQVAHAGFLDAPITLNTAAPQPSDASHVGLTSGWVAGGMGNRVINLLSTSTGITASLTQAFRSHNPLAPFALSLVALFFIIETLNKSVSFEKVTIEMVVKLLIRLLIAKILVTYASTILLQIDQIIIASTNKVMDNMANFTAPIQSMSLLQFLPNDIWGFGSAFRMMSSWLNWYLYYTEVKNALGNGPLGILFGGAAMYFSNSFAKDIDKVLMFSHTTWADGVDSTGAWIGTHELKPLLPGAIAESGQVSEANIYTPSGAYGVGIFLLLGMASQVLTTVIYVVTTIQIFITVMLREVELLILALLAPIAMAAFVSDEFKGQTKKFIMQFATLSLQAMVIVVMCKFLDRIVGNPYNMMNFVFDVDTSPGGPAATNYSTLTSYILKYMNYIAPGSNLMNSFGKSLIAFGFFDPIGMNWGFMQPIKLLFYGAINPIIVSMMVGKSRQIASTLMGG